ncbi:MAG TPA: protein translocase subunit SecD [Clostridiaceae bacterium]|nr:protein translocase subunit SecD [Clostridiaceae bacterium]
MRAMNWVKFFLVIIIIGALTYLTFTGIPGVIPNIYSTRLGIDIRGGVYANLYPDLPEGEKPTADQLNSARSIIEKRLDSKSIYDRNITTEPENGRIIVEIPYKPGETDLNPQKAIEEIGKTALLTFQEVDEDKFNGYREDGTKNYEQTGRIVIEGKHVVEAKVGQNPQTGEIVVTLKLNEEGAKRFAEATERLVGQKIAIYMDDVLITAPTVNEKIPNGEAIITGQRTAAEAGDLADTINAGSLPFRMVSKDLNAITPLLGEGALRVTINAGIIAFILICLFMLVNYRLPGLIANIALFGLIIATLFFISVLGVTLTLPGIAGIILSIGMGVDANVVIFERIREEIKSGKTVAASIDAGFKRAFAAIVDGNVTTIMTGLILYWFGTGPIKGFAVTLIIGVVISFFTAVTATRTMLITVSGLSVAKKPWLFRVKEVSK